MWFSSEYFLTYIYFPYLQNVLSFIMKMKQNFYISQGNVKNKTDNNCRGL